MNYAVIDTETTGMDQEQDALIEIAAVWNDGAFLHSLVCPNTRQITFGAMAVHHITDAMVAGAPSASEAVKRLGFDQNLPTADTGPTVLIFHNAKFDRDFLPDWMQKMQWICTYRCALHLFPDAESFKNGALWYELGLDRAMPPEAGSMPHRALFDALMTWDLLQWMLSAVADKIGRDQNACLEYLIKLSTTPVILKTCYFGKHHGTPWEDVPYNYMQWVLKQDFDSDVQHTCQHWVDKQNFQV